MNAFQKLMNYGAMKCDNCEVSFTICAVVEPGDECPICGQGTIIELEETDVSPPRNRKLMVEDLATVIDKTIEHARVVGREFAPTSPESSRIAFATAKLSEAHAELGNVVKMLEIPT